MQLQLVTALLFLEPSLSFEVAQQHVLAAERASEQTHEPPELLLAIAFVESHYDARTLSWMSCPASQTEHCERKVGRWPFQAPPKGAKPSFYCGPMQVGGYVPWKRCIYLMQDLQANYLTGAEHLSRWKRDVGLTNTPCAKTLPDSSERLSCALLGYNGGYASFENRTSGWYSRRVFAVRHQIERMMRAPNT